MSKDSYFLQHPNGAELTRLLEQASLMKEFVPLLPPCIDKSDIYTILDIGCGPGTWALDVAFHYPDARVIGLDNNSGMVRYAEAWACSQELENVSFQSADARERLPFFDTAFDLVHIQLATSWVKNEIWLSLLQEIRRVLRPGKFIVFTDCQLPETNSSGFKRLNQLLLDLLRDMHLGMCKEEDTNLGVLYSLGPLLHQAAFLAIKVEIVDINFSFSEAATHKHCFDDLMALFTQLRPQILDEEMTTWEDYQQLLAQFTQEAWLEDFVGISKLYTFTAHT